MQPRERAIINQVVQIWQSILARSTANSVVKLRKDRLIHEDIADFFNLCYLKL